MGQHGASRISHRRNVVTTALHAVAQSLRRHGRLRSSEDEGQGEKPPERIGLFEQGAEIA
jgi:hypothetical protein